MNLFSDTPDLFENQTKTPWQKISNDLFVSQAPSIDLSLKSQEINYALLPSHPSIQAIFFDMDATLIQEETLVYLAEKYGVGLEVEKITNEAMNGQLDFATSLKKRMELLKDFKYDDVLKAVDQIHIHAGVKNFLTFLQSKKIKTFLISGGFKEFAEKLKNDLNLDGYQTNTFEIVNHKLSGQVVGDIIDAQKKSDFVQNTLKSLAISPQHAAIFGDGANDIPMAQMVPFAFGFNPKQALRPFLCSANYTGSFAWWEKIFRYSLV